MGVIQRQGIKNTLIAYVGIVIGFISLLVIQPLILSPSEIGLTRILLSFSSVLASVMPLGMINVTIRFFPVFKNQEKNHHGFLFFVLLISLGGYLVLSGLLFAFREEIKSLYSGQSALFSDYFDWVFIFSFFLSFTSVLSAYCTANLKTTVPTFINDIYIRVASLVVFLIYYFGLIDIHFFVAFFVLIYGSQLLLLLWYTGRLGALDFRIDWNFLKANNIRGMTEYGLLFTVGVLSSIGLRYFDSIILGIYMPLSAVGVYSVCAFIPTIVEVPLLAIEKISNPKIAQFWETNNTADINKTYRLSVKVLSIISSFIFLMIAINLRYLLAQLPAQYMQAYDAVLIILAGALVNAFTGINNSILFFSKKYKTGLLLLVYLLLCTLLLDVILIPVYGLNGAAAATALSLVQYNFFKYLYIRKAFKMDPYTWENLKVFISLVLLMMVYFAFLKDIELSFMNALMSSVGFALAFTLLLFMFKVINLSVFEEMKKIFQRN
ncbi:MAG: hypothetical protein RLZZ46_1526 [Bacteroidota bacterium]|jgi:O-antigen/teichoic acid export membrane protein